MCRVLVVERGNMGNVGCFSHCPGGGANGESGLEGLPSSVGSRGNRVVINDPITSLYNYRYKITIKLVLESFLTKNSRIYPPYSIKNDPV